MCLIFQLSDWLTRQACEMLGTNPAMGDSVASVTTFLNWHQALSGELLVHFFILYSICEEMTMYALTVLSSVIL